MIQLLGLRAWVPKDSKDGQPKTFDKPYPIDIPLATPKELFQRLDEVLDKIHPDERWNLFYTLAACGEKREFKWTKTIAFDIDKINPKYEDAIIEVVLSALKLSRAEVGIVGSGNGYHFLIELKEAITDKTFFEKTRPHYKAVCAQIDEALAKAGLEGKADTAIFDARRILRVPGTINRKPDKPETRSRLLNKIGTPVDFRLEVLSGLPVVDKTEQVDKRFLAKFPRVYPAAVLEGCDFLKSCLASPNAIDEPAWYAALSITSRLDGEGSTGRERSHELSRGHRGYSAEETDKKIDQAMDASGPRTCESIGHIFNGCKQCPNFGKVTSPLLIRGADAIPTEDTGFHTVIVQKNGAQKVIPAYDDLRRFFERETNYKVLGGSRIVYVWKKTHYEQFEDAYLQSYAQEKFKPAATATTKMVQEFANLVSRTNIKGIDWWEENTKRKLNFKNGYLDIDTMEFRPHDPELGFRHVLPYEYDPAATAPMFKKMLALVTGSDPEMIAVLEEFMGYCLSNDSCWAQKALVLTGEGSNGKSTFLDTLKALAGKGNYSSVNMAKIDEAYQLANLDKSLFNISEETPPKAFRDNSTFKNLVTGGTFVVRIIYEKTYEITNRAKLILTCNQLPDSLDNTHGFYRRLLIVPFNQTIDASTPGFDPYMSEKLLQELPGIFNMAIAAYHRLRKARGFTSSHKLKESLDEYRLDNDTVLYWVSEHLIVHKNGTFDQHFTPIGDLYTAYRDAMRSVGKFPLDKPKFEKQLAKVRGDVWGEHPYAARATRKRLEVRGKSVQVRGLQGVELDVIN